MAYKFNIRNATNDGWVNLFQASNIDVLDVDNKFLQSTVEGVLEEIYDSKPNIKRTSTSPTSGDDSSLGYRTGDIWVDQIEDYSYVCVDSTQDDAKWELITQPNYSTLTASVTASVNNEYFVDTTSGSFDVYLPNNPSYGEKIKFVPGSDWYATNFTIKGKVNGATDMICDQSFGIILQYFSATWGWSVS